MPEVSCNLSSCFMCTHCLTEWKEAISVKKKTILFKKGKSIFREGEEVRGIFFVFSGSVKVTKQWGEDKELIIRFAGTGQVLGHRGLGGGHHYPISAHALEDTKLCYIPGKFLEATLRTNPAFTYQLLHVYAAELQTAEKRMRDLAHMDVKGRIAQALLDMAAVFGWDDQNFIRVPVSRQDIASYAGTTYETVFKFFTGLTSNRVLVTEGKKIKISKPAALKKFIQD